MKKTDVPDQSAQNYSRRKFLGTLATASAGLLIVPAIKPSRLFAGGLFDRSSFLAQVAVTQATTYDQATIKARVQHLFDSLGGISDVVKSGDKVAIKINLTGGGGGTYAYNMWTHPEVLRAVGELLIDCGVKGSDIYIVEALWNTATYTSYGYEAVQTSLGAQLVNLNQPAPYADFISRPVGSNSFQYAAFTQNGILSDVNVYVSIPKMKQHYEAGVTGSLKNQIGTVPIQLYTVPTNTGRRDALHTKDGTVSSTTWLPRAICDLNLARPVHLAVIDGVKNARGGEGTWNPTFAACEDHVLLAGKDPVATDSIMAHLMGNDPEAATVALPGGGQADNHLYLLHGKGIGTNQMNEIEVVGDGARVVSVPHDSPGTIARDFRLYQNYPNPFNPSTTIKFNIPRSEHVSVRIYTLNGRELETLIEGEVGAGEHDVRWSPRNLSSGMYICRMQAGKYSVARKMIYQK